MLTTEGDVTAVSVIDTDPAVLAAASAAALHAADETWMHIAAEITAADGDYDKLLTTLRPQGPYGYTIQPDVRPDGSVRAPILSTREEIRVAYEQVRGESDLLRTEPMVEIRGAWYTFHEAVGTGQVKGEAEPRPGSHILALFPVGAGQGITGELVWPWVPTAMLGRGASAETLEGLPGRRALLERHDLLLGAYAAGDADAIVELFHDDLQGGVRDYVSGSGRLIELQGKPAAAAHYRELFAIYEVLAVELLHRVVQDWYVFAEVRVTAQRPGTAAAEAFHLAEYSVAAKDGRFVVRIGHGTDPAPTTAVRRASAPPWT